MTDPPSTPATQGPRFLRFDPFLVDRSRRRLFREGVRVAVTPKAISILLILIERRGEVVGKDELLQAVWPDTFVTEANLTQNVSALRKALGETANDHRYVVTFPGHGYSFVTPVWPVGEDEAEVELAASSGEPSGSSGCFPLSETSEISDMFEGSETVERRGPSGKAGGHRGRWLAAGLAVALLAATTAVLPRLLSRLRPAGDAGRAGSARLSIAVLGFDNYGQEEGQREEGQGEGQEGDAGSAWLSPALAEMMTTELASGGRIRVVSGETAARARATLRATRDAAPLDADSLRRLHSILGSDVLVTGSYAVVRAPGEDERIQVDLRAVRMPGGEVVAALSEVGREADLFDLVGRAGRKLRDSLGLQEPSPEQERVTRSLQPANRKAARLYAEGLEQLRTNAYLRAVELLREAAEADPKSATIQSALAQAWVALGYDARAVAAARRAVELSQGLPREDRLAIRARFHEASRQWSQAGDDYRTLWTFHPDDLEHGLRLATSLYSGGRGADALDTLAELRKLPPPSGQDPRIDLTEARARFRLSDQEGAVRAARIAEAKGRASGERLMVGQALVVAGQALTVLGRPAEAVRAFEEARGIYRAEGDDRGLASALANHGILLYLQGDLAGAEKLHLQTLDLVRKVGNLTGIAAQLGNLGLLHQKKGDLPRALSYLERARAEVVAIQDPFLESRVLSSIASVLLSQGELAAARSRAEGALALGRKIGNRNAEGRALHNLAAVLVWEGKLHEASGLAERSYGLLKGGDLIEAGSALAVWADATARLGDLPGARRRLEEALALKRKANDRIAVARLLGSLANLQVLEGNLAGARKTSAEELQIARGTGSRSLLAWSLQVEACIQLASGALAESRRSLEQGLAESEETGEHLRAMLIRGDLARLALAEGDDARAAGLAEPVSAWCRERGNSWCEADSKATEAHALASQGRKAEALAAAARVRMLTEASEDRALARFVAPRLALASSPQRSPPG